MLLHSQSFVICMQIDTTSEGGFHSKAVGKLCCIESMQMHNFIQLLVYLSNLCTSFLEHKGLLKAAYEDFFF